MFVSLLRKGFYLLCALMLFGFSSTNWKLSIILFTMIFLYIPSYTPSNYQTGNSP